MAVWVYPTHSLGDVRVARSGIDHVYYRNWQCVLIEEILRVLGVIRFDWTLEFSPLTRTEKNRPPAEVFTTVWCSTRELPAGGIYVLGLIVYVVFSVLSIIILPPILAENAGYVNEDMWFGIVIVFYSILTLTLFGNGYTSRRIRSDFERRDGDDEASAA